MQFQRSHFAAAFAALALAAPAAHAVTATFETVAPGAFFNGQSFASAGYTFTVGGDFGIVDTVAACTVVTCPTGNATRFYYGANDSQLVMTATGGGLFTLQGFDAAFLAAQVTSPGVDGGRLVVTGFNAAGSPVVSNAFALAPSTAGGFPFRGYSGAAFAAFTNLRSVAFSACSFVGTACVNPNANLGQFALDNVVAVPEPATALLWAAGSGVAALALARRRRSRTPATV